MSKDTDGLSLKSGEERPSRHDSDGTKDTGSQAEKDSAMGPTATNNKLAMDQLKMEGEHKRENLAHYPEILIPGEF